MRANLERSLRQEAVDRSDGALDGSWLGNDIEQLHPDFRSTIWLGAPRQILRRPFQLRLDGDARAARVEQGGSATESLGVLLDALATGAATLGAPALLRAQGRGGGV